VGDAKRQAAEKAIRELENGLADADRINDAAMKAYLAAPLEVRRGLIQRREESPLAGERLVEVAEYVLKHDPEENVRTHAVCRLGYGDLKGTPDAGRVLVRAVKDPSAQIRQYACQSLWQHGNADHAPAVRPLLADADKDVRYQAVTTLGRLGDTKALPDILKLHAAEKPNPNDAATFAESLARLGEQKVSASAAVEAMQSFNWNVRHSAVEAVGHLKGDAAVPPLVTCLGLELNRVIAGEKMTGFAKSTPSVTRCFSACWWPTVARSPCG
jgi:HEAT repeats/PBS lyase HEAT-like repeat